MSRSTAYSKDAAAGAIIGPGGRRNTDNVGDIDGGTSLPLGSSDTGSYYNTRYGRCETDSSDDDSSRHGARTQMFATDVGSGDTAPNYTHVSGEHLSNHASGFHVPRATQNLSNQRPSLTRSPLDISSYRPPRVTQGTQESPRNTNARPTLPSVNLNNLSSPHGPFIYNSTATDFKPNATQSQKFDKESGRSVVHSSEDNMPLSYDGFGKDRSALNALRAPLASLATFQYGNPINGAGYGARTKLNSNKHGDQPQTQSQGHTSSYLGASRPPNDRSGHQTRASLSIGASSPYTTSTHDSGFEELESTRLAELIRSGATESASAANRGIGGGMSTSNDDRELTVPLGGLTQPVIPKIRMKDSDRTWGAVSSSSNQQFHGVTANLNGVAAAFLGLNVDQPPAWFAAARSGQFLPSVQDSFESLPFIQACRHASPMTAGVIKIKNVPYLTNRSEILAFLGRQAQVCMQPPGSPFYAVHIITDRYNGKTMDAFIEMKTPNEASWVVSQFDKRVSQGRPLRIGDRQVFVTLSSQQSLLEEMFCRAKYTGWKGATPKVSDEAPRYYEQIPSTGFDGFLAHEELAMMSKYAETPHRSPFIERCPVRVYENLISTLHKYPWYAYNHVLLKERDAMFDVSMISTRALITMLRNTNNNMEHDPKRPTISTLQELIVAVLTCPGFSESQKAALASVVSSAGYGQVLSSRGMNLRFGGTHKHAADWPFKILAKRPGYSDEFIEYYATLMKKGNFDLSTLSLADIHDMRESGAVQAAFGNIEIDYGDATTLAGIGRIELRRVEELLRLTLPDVSTRSPAMEKS